MHNGYELFVTALTGGVVDGFIALIVWLIRPPTVEANDFKISERSTQTAADPNEEFIADLRQQIILLRAAEKTAIEQRDSCRQQLLLAEERLRTQRNSETGKGDGRYSALKTFLARRFHPDQAPGSGFEKLVRTEIFKEIWEEIGRIDSAP